MTHKEFLNIWIALTIYERAFINESPRTRIQGESAKSFLFRTELKRKSRNIPPDYKPVLADYGLIALGTEFDGVVNHILLTPEFSEVTKIDIASKETKTSKVRNEVIRARIAFYPSSEYKWDKKYKKYRIQPGTEKSAYATSKF